MSRPDGDQAYEGLPRIEAGERRHAETELREREQQYRDIFEATSDGLIINDLETGIVVEANPAACRMHGYSYEELIGLHPHVFIHPDVRELLNLQEVRGQAKPYQIRQFLRLVERYALSMEAED